MTASVSPGPEPEQISPPNAEPEPPRGRDQLMNELNWQSRRSSVLFGLLNRSVAARIGLNPTDVEALGVLSVLGAITPTQLASLLGMGTGAVTQVIDRLEHGGFARRARDTRDRRRVSIELAPDRAREVGAFYSALQNDAAALTGGYDDRDLALIVDYLTRANDILRHAGSAAAAAGQTQPPAKSEVGLSHGGDSPDTG
jgi:DNA-binding MarR family transcriptional regulator